MFKYLKKENINIFAPNMDSFKYDEKYWKITRNTAPHQVMVEL